MSDSNSSLLLGSLETVQLLTFGPPRWPGGHVQASRVADRPASHVRTSSLARWSCTGLERRVADRPASHVRTSSLTRWSLEVCTGTKSRTGTRTCTAFFYRYTVLLLKSACRHLPSTSSPISFSRPPFMLQSGLA